MAVVAIFTYEDKGRVWPPYVLVKPGEEVVFKTLDTEAKVVLPAGDIFAAGTAREFTVKAKSASTVRVKKDGAVQRSGGTVSYTNGNAEPGVYPYRVFREPGGDEILTNSTPVMIVEPPEP